MPIKDTLNWREFITRPALQKKKKKKKKKKEKKEKKEKKKKPKSRW